jgi:hypothetical protein
MSDMVYDVENVLVNLGLDYTVRGSEANALCPAHEKRTGRPDQNPSWWVNLETGKHVCFSCHFQGGILTLIAEVQGFSLAFWGSTTEEYDFDSARAWLAEVDEVDPDRLAMALTVLRTPKPVEGSSLAPMSPARLAVFGPPPEEALAARRVSRESVDRYSVLWRESNTSWVLPIYWQDHTGTPVLLGWQEKGQGHKYFATAHPA